MKKQICFIHGGSAFSSYDAYIKYLKTTPVREPYYTETKKRWKETLFTEFGDSHDVLYPSMPNSNNACYEEWKIWFERYFEHLTGDIILIGHSQGGFFLAKYLSENTPKIHIIGLYLVAAPFSGEGLGDEDGGDFNFDTSKLENMTKQCDKIYVLHSKDDPIVPVSHGTSYKKVLPAVKYMEFEDRGHFLQETFLELIESIKNLT